MVHSSSIMANSFFCGHVVDLFCFAIMAQESLLHRFCRDDRLKADEDGHLESQVGFSGV